MKHIFLPACVAASFALPALACDGLDVAGPYARVSTMMSQSGAAFMTLANHGSADCRLVGARSDAAARVELHTHTEDDAGVMRMREVEGGIAIPAGGTHELARGGDHLMFLGLTTGLKQGDEVAVTLLFEDGAETEIVIPVDLERMPDHGHGHSHGHGHGQSQD